MTTIDADLQNLPDRQQREIADLRAFLKPSPVRLHHVPNWFRLAILRAYGCEYGNTAGWGVVAHAFRNATWLDHWGSTRLSDKRLAFVSEPYQLSQDEAKQVQAIADAIGCHWWPTANSWWYPQRTTRIVFAPRVEQ